MAKSMRSKTKRAFRRTKREAGVFAAADAARLERLSKKLAAKVAADKDGDAPMEEEAVAEGEDEAGEGESLKVLVVAEDMDRTEGEGVIENEEELRKIDELNGLDVGVDELESIGLEWDAESEEAFYGILGLLDINQLGVWRCNLSNWDL